MKPSGLLLLLIVSLIAEPSRSAESIFQDGGFEQYQVQPDDYGNPFKAWSGWKWDGNCRRAADTQIKHEGQASAEMLSYRAIKTGDEWLAFVNNLDAKNDSPVKVTNDLKITAMRNLTLERDLPLSFTVPAGETYILRLTGH